MCMYTYIYIHVCIYMTHREKERRRRGKMRKETLFSILCSVLGLKSFNHITGKHDSDLKDFVLYLSIKTSNIYIKEVQGREL